MADSLVLKGVKDVSNHTGDEIRIISPKVGDVHQVKQWTTPGPALYVNCTVFEVTSGGQTRRLAVPSGAGTEITIEHDGAFGFTFSNIRECAAAAQFSEDMQYISSYEFDGNGEVAVIGGDELPPGPTPPPYYDGFYPAPDGPGGITKLTLQPILNDPNREVYPTDTIGLQENTVQGQVYTGVSNAPGVGTGFSFKFNQILVHDNGPGLDDTWHCPVSQFEIVSTGQDYAYGDTISYVGPDGQLELLAFVDEVSS